MSTEYNSMVCKALDILAINRGDLVKFFNEIKKYETNSSRILLEIINVSNIPDYKSNIEEILLTLKRNEVISLGMVINTWSLLLLTNFVEDELGLISNKNFICNILKNDRLFSYTREDAMALVKVLEITEPPHTSLETIGDEGKNEGDVGESTDL